MGIFKKRKKAVLTDSDGVQHSVTLDDILEIKVRKDSSMDFYAMMSGDNSLSCIFADFTTAAGTFSVDCDNNKYKNVCNQLAPIFPKEEFSLFEMRLLRTVTSLILEPFDKSFVVYTKKS